MIDGWGPIAELCNDALEHTLLGRENEQAYREAKTMDSEVRWRLAERSAELCDGHGAERAAEAILTMLRPR